MQINATLIDNILIIIMMLINLSLSDHLARLHLDIRLSNPT